MEAAGVAIYPGATRLVKSRHNDQYHQSSSCASIPATSFGCRAIRFRDSGHLDFYCKAKRGGGGALVTARDKEKKEAKKKKKLKLLQGLSKDISTLTQMDLGSHITEAAQVLMKHLQQLQAQEKEHMRKEKENNAGLAMVHCDSSSSSESSSRDDECCDHVIDISSSCWDCATSVAAAQPTTHLLGPDKSTSVPTLEAHGSLAIYGRASVPFNDEVNTTSAVQGPRGIL